MGKRREYFNRIRRSIMVRRIIEAILGTNNCSDKVLSERLRICNDCPEFDKLRCKQCGCFVALKVKPKESECPLGYW